MEGSGRRVGNAALGAFLGAVVIGGANFVAVKETVEELEPLYGAATRFGLASLVFFGVVALARPPLPRGRALLGAAVYGVLAYGVSYALLYVALVELSAGVGSVVMATVPVLALLLAAMQGLERLAARGLAGGALAIAGIVVLSADQLGGSVPAGHLVAALLAPVAVAQSVILAKRLPRMDPVATNAVGMLAASVLLAVASVAAGEAWALPRSADTWAAVVWLILVGSVGLFWLVLFVVQRWTASATSYALPLMPVVAVALAVGRGDEGLGPEKAVGGLLVIAGAYVGAVSRPRGAASPAPAGGAPPPRIAPAAEQSRPD